MTRQSKSVWRTTSRRITIAIPVLAAAISGCWSSQPANPQPAPQIAQSASPATVPSRPDVPATSIQFREVPVARSHLTHVYKNAEEAGVVSIVESLGGGAALLDVDRDGDLDVVLPGGGIYTSQTEMVGRPSSLSLNQGGLTFTDVSAAAGVMQAPYYSHGSQGGDFDSDGFPDVLLTGYGGVQLFRNQGDGTFQEISRAAGLTDTLWSSSAAWGDFNRDGNLDLYIAHYVDWSFENHPWCDGPDGNREVCPPKRYAGLPDALYQSRGDGTFADVSRSVGLAQDGKGLGVLAADIDVDGDLDICVANDTVPNFLLQNQGQGTFREIGDASGTALSDLSTPDGSMGLDTLDFNLDGRPDLWVVNYERESIALYRNEGDCQFLHVSRAAGVTAAGGLYVSFGTVCFDADRDGDEDAFVSNGHVIRYPLNAPLTQVPLFFEVRKQRFFNVAAEVGEYFTREHMGRGVAAGDLDNDGDIDLLCVPMNAPVSLLENQTPAQNSWWLQVELVGRTSHRDAVGARLILHSRRSRQLRLVKGGGSYLSQSDMAPFWGGPLDDSPQRLEIVWPSGIRQVVPVNAVNQRTIIREPAE